VTAAGSIGSDSLVVPVIWPLQKPPAALQLGPDSGSYDAGCSTSTARSALPTERGRVSVNVPSALITALASTW
jgi:hypothetical protein